MKIHLLAVVVITISAATAVAETYRAPVTRPRARMAPRPAPIYAPYVTGVIPRAIRGGNPLQMFNPNAPRKYGTSLEAITYDQNDPAKWRGIKFFEIRF
jgi:hypothetical protein